MTLFTRFLQIITLLILVFAFCLVTCFKPLTKEDQIESYKRMNDHVEPFSRNLTECARQVRATMADVQNFLQMLPQKSLQGKCFVACIFKRNEIIRNNKINLEKVLEANKAVYGENSQVLESVKKAVVECRREVQDVFEICEYASLFNDCMQLKMDNEVDKAMMERRMQMLGRMARNPNEESDDEEEMLKLAKDEL